MEASISQETLVCLDIIQEVSSKFMYPNRRPILLVLAPVRICGNSIASVWAIAKGAEKVYIWVDNMLIRFLQKLALNEFYERKTWNNVEFVFLPCRLLS